MPTMWVSRIRAITASTLIGGVGLGACAPEMNWREVHPVDADGLVAWFPCKPEAVERSFSWPGVPQARVHVLSCRSGDALWALRYARVPDVPQIGGTLRLWGQEASHLPGYKAESIMNLAVPGMTPQPQASAWALTWAQPAPDRPDRPMHAVTWHFSHGLTVFQASVWRATPFESGAKGEDVAQTFKNGLHFPN